MRKEERQERIMHRFQAHEKTKGRKRRKLAACVQPGTNLTGVFAFAEQESEEETVEDDIPLRQPKSARNSIAPMSTAHSEVESLGAVMKQFDARKIGVERECLIFDMQPNAESVHHNDEKRKDGMEQLKVERGEKEEREIQERYVLENFKITMDVGENIK